jgi:hypothetical protein
MIFWISDGGVDVLVSWHLNVSLDGDGDVLDNSVDGSELPSSDSEDLNVDSL